MTHFHISDWTDFGRGCAAEADRVAMEAHLATGCRRCRAALQLVQRVVALTRDESRFEPPANVVRCAKAISALQRRSPVDRVVARLVYDSFSDPVPVGMRSEGRISRHTFYEAGDFSLDLRLEQGKGSPFVSLVGQLTHLTDPATSLPGAPVLLLAQENIVAHAVYNRFGEFQMDYPPARHLRLCVALNPPSKRIDLSLDRLGAEMPASRKAGPARPHRKKKAGQSRH